MHLIVIGKCAQDVGWSMAVEHWLAKVAYGIAIVALNIVNLTYVENKKVWNIDYDYIQNVLKMFMKLVFMWLSKYDFLVSDHVSKNITKSTDLTIEYRGLKRKRNQGLQRLRQVLLSWNRVLQAIWMVHLSYLQSIIPVYANKESIKE